jgi:hypothetical protein
MKQGTPHRLQRIEPHERHELDLLDARATEQLDALVARDASPAIPWKISERSRRS